MFARFAKVRRKQKPLCVDAMLKYDGAYFHRVSAELNLSSFHAVASPGRADFYSKTNFLICEEPGKHG